MSKITGLRKIMYAKSIAVIGASNKPGSVGNETMKRLLSYGFKGRIFPVNPKETEIEGVKAYKKVADIGKNIDFAFIAVPSKAVIGVVEECHMADIQNVIVVSSGFKEIGGEGIELEKQLQNKVKAHKMNLIGPNCLGVINTNTNMNATFIPVNPARSGKVGFVSQSGAIACGIINLLQKKNFGFSQVVSIGNQADVDFLDIVELWEEDENIEIIMLYIEGINDAEKFKEICSRVSRKKPIIMLKAGRSEKGATATASHTGTLAGDEKTISAVIENSGVIREVYLRDFISTVQLFSNSNMPSGNKLAILTNAGGPGIIATDTASDFNIDLAELNDKTKANLRKFLPEVASVKNPVDIIASASLEQFSKSAKELLDAKEVDVLLVIYLYITVRNDSALIKELEDLKKQYPNKTIVAVFQTSENFYSEIADFDSTIPLYHYGVDALHSIKKLLDRKESLSKKNACARPFNVDKTEVKKIIKKNELKKVTTLSLKDSLDIFKTYGIPLAKYGYAKNLPQAKKIASQIGYPVVVKISSSTITHKTDVGGVITNILNEKDLKAKWPTFLRDLEKNKVLNQVDGFIVMEQIKGNAREFVAGTVKKSNMPMMMFGIGGIFIETLNEVAFAPCPLNLFGLEHLLTSTKAGKMLGKVRDYAPADRQKIAETLLRLSQLICDFKEIKEIDVNPIIADKQGRIISVDARIVI